MSGADDVTVVWLAPETGDREDAARALAEWGRARGLRITAAAEGARSGPPKIDFTIADRVEKELDRAREATAALDADAAERALARAETLLRDHPELPQAAWLRAEVHRSWASRWSRLDPRDDQRAREAWQEADALDGGRAAGIGETAFPPRAHGAVTLSVLGASSAHLVRLVVRLDGNELAAAEGASGASGARTYALDVPPAEHQVVVTIDGDIAFASWVAIAESPAGAPRITIPIRIGDSGSCSAASLSSVTRLPTGGVQASGVTCDDWVAAVPAERRGAVLVARCERSNCGPFLEWRSEGAFGALGPPAVAMPHRGPWPAWATWTAIGVGAVAAATIALVATGVFESHPTEQRFVAGGVRVE